MKSKALSILVVEDDLLSRLSLKSRLESYGLVSEASSAHEAKIIKEMNSFDVAFIDLDLEHDLAGLELIKEFKSKGTHVIVLSGREEDEIVGEAYERGCSDFLSKPFTKEAVESVLKKLDLQKSNHKNLEKLKTFFMTDDVSFISQLNRIEQAIYSTHPILITGETGTGKTFLAKFIHNLSDSEKPFIHLNCAEVAESLIESELFGHEKGSFTGAIKSKKGLLELADGGTLFLDEIATLSLAVQKKLLKALEEKTFYPVGSEKPVQSSFRLISATCENLKIKIETGEFRQDFLFRIEGFNVELKSLRDRKIDLLKIADTFLKKGSRRIILSTEVKKRFFDYSWPGNIRELERTIEVLRSRSTGIIQLTDLEGVLTHSIDNNEKFNLDIEAIKSMGLNAFIEKLETKILEKVLNDNSDKVRKTMQDLKISNNSFYRIMTNLKGKETSDVSAK
jgi:DNA-binding NtrC family response regulator